MLFASALLRVRCARSSAACHLAHHLPSRAADAQLFKTEFNNAKEAMRQLLEAEGTPVSTPVKKSEEGAAAAAEAKSPAPVVAAPTAATEEQKPAEST